MLKLVVLIEQTMKTYLNSISNVISLDILTNYATIVKQWKHGDLYTDQ